MLPYQTKKILLGINGCKMILKLCLFSKENNNITRWYTSAKYLVYYFNPANILNMPDQDNHLKALIRVFGNSESHGGM